MINRTPYLSMKLFIPHNHKSSRRAQDSLMHRVSNDPFLDWLILIIIASILSVLAIGSGFLVYNDTQTRLDTPAAADPSTRQVLFDADALSRTLRDFNIRAEEQRSLMKGYTGVADPSL